MAAVMSEKTALDMFGACSVRDVGDALTSFLLSVEGAKALMLLGEHDAVIVFAKISRGPVNEVYCMCSTGYYLEWKTPAVGLRIGIEARWECGLRPIAGLDVAQAICATTGITIAEDVMNELRERLKELGAN